MLFPARNFPPVINPSSAVNNSWFLELPLPYLHQKCLQFAKNHARIMKWLLTQSSIVQWYRSRLSLERCKVRIQSRSNYSRIYLVCHRHYSRKILKDRRMNFSKEIFRGSSSDESASSRSFTFFAAFENTAEFPFQHLIYQKGNSFGHYQLGNGIWGLRTSENL